LWRDIVALTDVFRGISNSRIRTRSSVLFWDYIWNDKIRSNTYPSLYMVALDKTLSVKQMGSTPLEDYFLLPLSTQAYGELSALSSLGPGCGPAGGKSSSGGMSAKSPSSTKIEIVHDSPPPPLPKGSCNTIVQGTESRSLYFALINTLPNIWSLSSQKESYPKEATARFIW
jgi:hypothetical protein